MESMALAGVAGAMTSSSFAAADDLNTDEPRKNDMLYRKLGRSGETVSAIGLGGYHIGTQKDERESIKIVRDAIDAGITFMDNSWDYHNGGSELRMGKASRTATARKSS